MSKLDHKQRRDPPPPPQGFDLSTRVRFPFEIGQLVKHRAAAESCGVVTGFGLDPTGCVVGVSWSPDVEAWEWHFALEHCSGDEDEFVPSALHTLPFAWGESVRHRASHERGAVTGYRVSERGAMIRVAWSASKWDWHHFCELAALEST